jgi:hypothetical protein
MNRTLAVLLVVFLAVCGALRVPAVATLPKPNRVCMRVRIIHMSTRAECLAWPASNMQNKQDKGRNFIGAVQMAEASGTLISGFESIADKYDGFILDQFGVMHNGIAHAVQTFDQ